MFNFNKFEQLSDGKNSKIIFSHWILYWKGFEILKLKFDIVEGSHRNGHYFGGIFEPLFGLACVL